MVVVKRNFTSPIVIAILLLALTLLVLGEKRDAWFISVVILVNTILAIVQEIRAQRELRKLELLSAPRARRKKSDGTTEEVMYNELCLDDEIEVRTGDEIPADGIIRRNYGLEVDESILTGESQSIMKDKDENVWAGSAVVAGSASVLVIAVGNDTKAGQMTSMLKRYVPRLTPLQQAINRTISFLTYGALGLATLIFVAYYLSGEDAIKIFKTITSAAVTVVPEGLLLASTLLLAYGSIRLAQAKVLPQKLGAIEAMALLSVLCVDKTGTLTSDIIDFDLFHLFSKRDQQNEEEWNKILGIVARRTSSGSATGRAIIDRFPVEGDYQVIDTMAFSSIRKTSGLRFKLSDKIYTVLMGAPECLYDLAPTKTSFKKQIDLLTSEGKRVLMVVSFDDNTTPLRELKNDTGVSVGYVVLKNTLRDNVQETVRYLQENNVSIRVISGDNPQTIKHVASTAGIYNSDSVITGAELEKLSQDEWDDTVRSTTIFARVLPEQKERLIATFRKQGRFTGMVGDGVNDALALKSADLGIAMYAGATATRRVADLILLDNSFTSLPIGMRLGNRIMQAIELIAILFFHKIIFGIVLLLSTIAVGTTYPFQPRHVTFMNIFLVTMPTIMWTLFPPLSRHRIRPQHFWRDTLFAVIPIALISGCVVAVVYWIASVLSSGMESDASTITVMVATFLGVYLVFLASKMLAVEYDKVAIFARLLYVGVASIVAVTSFQLSFARDFFDFSSPRWLTMWPILIVVFATSIIQYKIAQQAGAKLRGYRNNNN